MHNNIQHIKNQLLVLAAQDGDKTALEELVRRWHGKLWSYIARMTADHHAAADITQQCWLEIIKGLRKLHDPERFPAWAYKIATHKSIDWLKNNSRHRHVSLDTIDLNDSEPSADVPVKELLQRLTPQHRAVLNLHYFEQLRVAEIAVTLHIPQGTVKSRLFNARQELKRLWQEYLNQ